MFGLKELFWVFLATWTEWESVTPCDGERRFSIKRRKCIISFSCVDNKSVCGDFDDTYCDGKSLFCCGFHHYDVRVSSNVLWAPQPPLFGSQSSSDCISLIVYHPVRVDDEFDHFND